jgi:hypothetical protein
MRQTVRSSRSLSTGVVLAAGLILGGMAAPRSVPAGQKVFRSVPH